MGRLNFYSLGELYIAEVKTVNKSCFSLMIKTRIPDTYIALAEKTPHGYFEIVNGVLCDSEGDIDCEKYFLSAIKPLACYVGLSENEKYTALRWYKIIKDSVDVFLNSKKFMLNLKTSKNISAYQYNCIERIIIMGHYVEWKSDTQISMDILRRTTFKSAQLVFRNKLDKAELIAE